MGRFFNEGDTAGSPPVVVVNRAFVRAYFGDNREPGKIVGKSYSVMEMRSLHISSVCSMTSGKRL